MGVVEESDSEEDENVAGLQENYNSLLEKSGEYTRIAKVAVMKMIKAFTTCLANFNSRFEGHKSRTQSYRDITSNARDVWVKRGTHA